MEFMQEVMGKMVPIKYRTTGKRGPKPDTLKIEGDWKKAVKGALKKKRPAEGWPTDKPKKG